MSLFYKINFKDKQKKNLLKKLRRIFEALKSSFLGNVWFRYD